MHNITAYITKNDSSFEDEPYLKLPQDFILFVDPPENLKEGRLVAKVSTDYFGGVGEQSCKIWKDGVKIFQETSSYGAINKGLTLLGVIKNEDKDEFDTLLLGVHRENSEIEKIIYNLI
jgi:hypothetical protein